jgi:hypothetical protein
MPFRSMRSQLRPSRMRARPRLRPAMSFTFSPPHLRVPLFAKDSYCWNIEHRTFGNADSFPHSCFVMTKGEKLNNERIKKLANLNRNLKIENFSYVSSSSSDEDFTSRIEVPSESDNDDQKAKFRSIVE